MKLLLSIISTSYAYEQPRYDDFLRAIQQKNGGWGAPVGKLAAGWNLCPTLVAPTTGSIICDQSTCALVCDPGYIATGRRRTKCRFNTTKQFFWKKPLGGCDTCDPLPTPPAGITESCTFNARGKKKCFWRCDNGLDIQPASNDASWMALGAVCACPRPDRICGWKARKFNGIMTAADVNGLTCEAGTTAPPSPTTTTPPSPTGTTTTAPPATGTTTGTTPEFEALTNDISTTLTTCSAGARSSDKIVGGIDASQSNWPWIARLFLMETPGASSGFTCGGSLIDDRWLVTAAHCCEGIVEVDATFNDASDSQFESGEFTMNANQFFIHPGYGDQSDGNPDNMDICLIKFSSSVSASDTSGGTAEVCLATAYPDHGKACWIAGWGNIAENGGEPSVLQSAGVNILGQSYCLANSGETNLLPDDICAGLPDNDGNGQTDGGTDSCQGDSGGPLVCNVDGAATLVGVVSRGLGCAREGAPGLYTAVSTDTWIADTMAAN